MDTLDHILLFMDSIIIILIIIGVVSLIVKTEIGRFYHTAVDLVQI